MGETKTRASNVRVIAATNRNLEAEMAAGRFREDLFYRLNVIELSCCRLRERAADIMPLAEHLLRFFARQTGKSITGFAEPRGMPCFATPGRAISVNCAMRSSGASSSPPAHWSSWAICPPRCGGNRGRANQAERDDLDQMEAEHIRRILASTATIEEAAERLGIDPSTLYRKTEEIWDLSRGRGSARGANEL